MPSCRTAAHIAVTALGLTVASTLAAAAAAAPVPVAPGAPGRIAPASGGCPTFSWTSAGPELTVEIAVFPLTADATAAASQAPVLRQRLPTGATSWTAPADRCLTPGGYGWSVRAVADAGAGPWSEPSLFRIPASGRTPIEVFMESTGNDLSEDEWIAALRWLASRSRSETEEARPRARATSRETVTGPVAALEPPPLLPTPPSNPSLQLSGGVVAAGDYTFASPRPVFVDVPAFEFHLRDGAEDETWDLTANGYGFVAAAPDTALQVELISPLHLPQGATVTLFVCHFFDQNASADVSVRFRLRRRPFGSAADEKMAEILAVSQGSSTNVQGALTSTIVSPEVRNELFSYWVEGSWIPGAKTASLRFYGCTVVLTASSLAP